VLVAGGVSSALPGHQLSNVPGDDECSGVVKAVDALGDLRSVAAIAGGSSCIALGNVICTDATGIDHSPDPGSFKLLLAL
jgi:hypothetical protein